MGVNYLSKNFKHLVTVNEAFDRAEAGLCFIFHEMTN